MITRILYITIFLFAGLFLIPGCNKWLSVPPPVTQSLSTNVFADAGTANSAVAGMYSYMYQLNNAQSTFGGYHLSLYTGVSADEMFVPGSPSDPFYTNKLTKDNADVDQIWSGAYSAIYNANAILEGLAKSNSIPTAEKNQFIGEALFVRAFAHLYLVSLFGNIPWVSVTDVNLSRNIGRTSSDTIYSNIVSDLSKAEEILPEDYSPYNNERVRANKWVATALLSRVYLIQENWAEAASSASRLITETGLFNLEPNLADVFIMNSREAIWQFLSAGGQGYTIAGNWVNGSPDAPPAFAMSASLVSSFETGDLRFSQWIRTQILNQDTFFIPHKYQNSSGNIVNNGEYDMVMRLSEQYLIRAEAEAQQDNLNGAIEDINMIRLRAGLNPILPTTKDSVLAAIMQERKVEFFSEWGHRWLDLKRTNTIDQILGQEKPGWTPTASLYPIPVTEIGNNPTLTQNPGY